jgi:hydroxyethylthiazole kinase-like uncharacterized protein yjeF
MTIELSPLGLYQTKQIKTVETLAIKHGISEDLLMERAGKAAFHLLRECWSTAQRILVICGSGNNGGDGYVLARHAHFAGLEVKVGFLGDKQQLNGAALHARNACENAHIPIEPFDKNQLLNNDVIVDAIFGTGLARKITGVWYAAMDAINQQNIPVLSLDLPSGLDSDTGAVRGIAISATVTITFIGVKQGLTTSQGPNYSGQIYCDNLDLPANLLSEIPPFAISLYLSHLTHYLQPRAKAAHKGQFGHVLVIGGNYGMPGSVCMAALAALRVGAGLVTVATRSSHIPIVVSTRPELMCLGVETPQDLELLFKKATVIIIGPGLGQDEWAKALLEAAIAVDCPQIIDADALNLLAQENRINRSSCEAHHWILTPHSGEAARLLNQTPEWVESDRFSAVKALQEKYKGVCILKGAGSLVADPHGLIAVCRAGNPGMATGGMGDVLSGVLGGLLAQGLSLQQASHLGVCLHAYAGDMAAQGEGERGLLALDLLPYLRKLANSPPFAQGVKTY